MTTTEICRFNAEWAAQTSPKEFAVSIGVLGHASDELITGSIEDMRTSLYEAINKFNKGDRGECGCAQCSKRLGLKICTDFNDLSTQWVHIKHGTGFQTTHLLRYDGSSKKLVFVERTKKKIESKEEPNQE